MTFRNLGLFKLLLDKQYNGLAGHLQDFLECIFAIAEHDVTVAHEFAKIGSISCLYSSLEQTTEMVYRDADELICKTNARSENTEYADWIIREDAGCYMLGKNFENSLVEHVQKFPTMTQHSNYIYWS